MWKQFGLGVPLPLEKKFKIARSFPGHRRVAGLGDLDKRLASTDLSSTSVSMGCPTEYGPHHSRSCVEKRFLAVHVPKPREADASPNDVGVHCRR